jgi:hypothetical protein
VTEVTMIAESTRSGGRASHAWRDAAAALVASVSVVSVGLFMTTDISSLFALWFLTMLGF